MRRLAAVALVLGLAACASQPKPPTASVPGAPATGEQRPKSPYPPAQEDPSKRGHYTAGGLYAPHIKDSAPDVDIDVSRIPEPEVVAEPRSRYGNRSTYSVLGRNYHVMDDASGYVEQGLASYYGNKFHGRRTSNMEVYDMYAFSAAHKTLPLPSFARVTNLDNGRSVVVRVNDRGPFHEGRIIDLSYAAAVKLGITRAGTGRVEVRALLPGEAGPLRAEAPAPVDTPVAKAAPSDMDRLVAALPTATAATAVAAAARASTTGSVAGGDRLDLGGDGKPMTADEFDAWMRERQVRIATGRPGVPDNAGAPAAAAPVVMSNGDDGVVLQVASFAARDNADRALAMLRQAGIDGATLQGASANGQQVWRLRVGPLAAQAASALSSRITGLGFGIPQPVRE
jgi:rare lipoprotein A